MVPPTAEGGKHVWYQFLLAGADLLESDHVGAAQIVLDQSPKGLKSGRSGTLVGLGGAVAGVVETVQQVDGGYHKR